MLSCMTDSAHDTQHVYRVLYNALGIAQHEKSVNTDVLIASCLLHDIGRGKQYADPSVSHASAGGDMAYEFIKANGFTEDDSRHVRDCIYTHSYRKGNTPLSTEAKILFDADKLDAAGSMGIARTLLHAGKLSYPLYLTDGDGNIISGASDTRHSFFHEYNFKLKRIYGRFLTKRGLRLAKRRRRAAVSFYKSLYNEAESALCKRDILSELLE
jgi:uncharacterized protein